MTELVTATLQRLFARQASSARRGHKPSVRGRDVRSNHPDFADTRPVVFRSEAFAEDLSLTHGAA
ncbi:MAG: hypothetical protein ABI605_01620 [Rhizobacter sp.]